MALSTCCGVSLSASIDRIEYYLLKDFEKLKRKHNTRNALVFTSGEIQPETYLFFLRISRVFSMALLNINKAEDIRSGIQQAAKKMGPIDLLIFDVHGNRFFMELISGRYSVRDMHERDFDQLSPYAQIFVCACDAGSLTSVSLASEMARRSHRPVFASIESFDPSRTYFDASGQGKMISFGDDGRPNIYRFQQGRDPELQERTAADSDGTEEGDRKIVRSRYASAAMEGDVWAQYQYACILNENGEGEKAIAWHRKAASQGSQWSQNVLAEFLEENGDREGAIYWHRASAVQGYELSQYALAKLLRDNGDREGAIHWHLAAAAGGFPLSQHALANFFMGKGDWERAIFWHQQAAEQGHKVSQYALANLLLYKKGDREGAIFWHRKAAGQGQIWSQRALAALLEEKAVDEGL